VVPKHIFSNRLNSLRLSQVSHCRSLEGNEFHRRGPAVAKHRSPKVLCGIQYNVDEIADYTVQTTFRQRS